MYYIVITAILGVTATPETLPKAYLTLAECHHAIFSEIIPSYRPPVNDEEIIFICVKREGA